MLSLFLALTVYLTVILARSTNQVIGRQAALAPQTDKERADAVVEAFRFAWDGYYKYAFPNDDLQPVSNNSSNSRNGWGAGAIESLGTALIMQQPDIVDVILDFVPKIDFNKTDTEVSLFETTIRYLGGLLSAYDLLRGPLSQYNTDPNAANALLTQATRLADNLAFAFDTPSGVPSNILFLSNRTTDGSKTNGLATTGTLVLEWTRLSDLTGNQKYAKLAQKAMTNLLNPKPTSSEPFPGLVGIEIDIQTGQFQDAFGGWVGGADSFYEYLIKMYIYDPTRFQLYRDRWILAADSTIAHLASHPSSRPDLTFLAIYNNQSLIYESQHLACFDGGNFILGGLVLKEQKYIDFGLELVNGCHETYSRTLTGIGPEVFRWVTNDTTPDDRRNPMPSNDQKEFYDKAGFFITNSAYGLRPEVIESFYYAYRATNNQMYREWAWNAFVAINKTCRANSGFAELNDVNAPNGGSFIDYQESFFFAETMKYSYLIHAPDSELQVQENGINRWVYNTEAHPIHVAGR